MQSKKKQMQKSKSTRSPSENKNKLALVSKLSSAMKIKYRNLFFSIGYQDKDLQSDINQFLTTKYQNKLPKEAFVTVEEEILKKIKEKNPNSTTMRKSKNNPKRNVSSERRLKQSLQTEPVKPTLNKENKAIEEKDIKNDHYDMSTEPHELVDKLKIKMENDYQAKYLREQSQKYLEEEKALKNKKKQVQKEMFVSLQNQIREKELAKKQMEEAENKRIQIEQERERQKYLEAERIKREKRQRELSLFQKSYELLEKERKEQAFKHQVLYTMNPKGYFNDDESVNKQRQFKENFKKDCQKFNLAREEYLKQEKEKKKIEEELYQKQCEDLRKKQNAESNFIKQKVLARVKSQERIEALMKKIFDGQKKAENVKYIKEREEQELRKKIELEKEDMKRKQKIEEMKKSLDFYIDYKQKEKEKKKQLELQYLETANKQYNDYLTEETQKKKQLEDKKKQYRKELELQIQENKKRSLEDLKRSYGPMKSSKSQQILSEEDDLAILNSIK